MIKPEELAYYRSNITDKYVIEIDTILNAEERKKQNKPPPVDQDFKRSNYKRCKVCGEYKLLSEFYKHPLKPKGVFDYCKECCKAKAKERRKG